MTNLNEAYENAKVAAQSLRDAKAACDADIAAKYAAGDDDPVAAKPLRVARKEVEKVYRQATNAVLAAVDEIGAENVKNLREMYAELEA